MTQYYFFRNSKTEFKSLLTSKKELWLKNPICHVCKKNTFTNIQQLDLEHLIPVCMGGDIVTYDGQTITNSVEGKYELICKECHRKKTGFDKLLFNFLSKTDIVQGRNDNHRSVISPEELKMVYLQLKEMHKKAINDLEDW